MTGDNNIIPPYTYLLAGTSNSVSYSQHLYAYHIKVGNHIFSADRTSVSILRFHGCLLIKIKMNRKTVDGPL